MVLGAYHTQPERMRLAVKANGTDRTKGTGGTQVAIALCVIGEGGVPPPVEMTSAALLSGNDLCLPFAKTARES